MIPSFRTKVVPSFQRALALLRMSLTIASFIESVYGFSTVCLGGRTDTTTGLVITISLNNALVFDLNS